jgi:DNA polymerase I-like protein with 3'-5' exonuclease and polymerase domains
MAVIRRKHGVGWESWRRSNALKRDNPRPSEDHPEKYDRGLDLSGSLGIIAVDTETTGLSALREDEAFMVAVWRKAGGGQPQSLLWEWPVDPHTRKVHYDETDLVELQVVLDMAEKVVFHNAKYDLQMLGKVGLRVPLEKVEDTSFVARVCSTDEMSYGLKPLAIKYLGIPDDDQKALAEVVEKLRRLARKRGWNLAQDRAADYWLLQYAEELGLNPGTTVDTTDGFGRLDELCRIYCLRDTERTWKLWEFYNELMDNERVIYARRGRDRGNGQGREILELGKETWRRAYSLEKELLEVVMAMEQRGMHISRSRAEHQHSLALERRSYHLGRLREMTGNPEFNPASPIQLAAYLYSPPPAGLGLRVMKLSGADNRGFVKPRKDGKPPSPSTDYTALRQHLGHPFVQELVLFRNADKSICSFFAKYLNLMRPDPLSLEAKFPGKDVGCSDDYVIYGSLNQCGTVTGRFSSSDPNLQNLPNPESSRKGTDIHGRDPFGPRPGYNWYCVDFAQMELRVFADCAQVPGILEQIKEGKDPNNFITNRAWGGKGNPAALQAAADSLELGSHEPTNTKIQAAWDELGWSPGMSEQYGVRSDQAFSVADQWLEKFSYEIVAAELSIDKKVSRARGKTVVFAEIYGGGPDAVTELLYCSRDEAVRFMASIERPFPEIKRYMEKIIAEVRRTGCIINRYGRRILVNPDFAYKGCNFMIQGSCSDLMKNGLRKCHRYFKELGIDAFIVNTVHDEIVFEIRKEHAYKPILRQICKLMTETDGCLGVPMAVEISVCTETWEKKEKVKLS